MKEKIRAVKMLITDVDGVLTDGKLYYLGNGVEAKSFDVKDGFIIRLAIKLGLRFGIITGKMSSIVERRAKELGIEEVHQGYFDKLTIYEGIKKRQGLEDKDIAYIGDDLFDLGVLTSVGFSACPSDAAPEVKEVVDYITEKPGGKGAIRELIELHFKAKGQWDDIVKGFITSEIYGKK